MTCSVDACNEPGAERTHEMLLSLCRHHGLAVADLYAESVIAKEDARRLRAGERATDRELVRQGNPSGKPVVYYAEIGGYIKIGFTTRLRDRLRTLRADRLLAWEPGGIDLERIRHQRFSEARIDMRRENFRPTAELTAHATSLRGQYGLPEWATHPRTTVITRRIKEDA